MSEPRHPIPAWVTRGKTIRQLIEELKSFENQDLEVRLSLDYGDTHHTISIVQGCGEGKYCLLVNAENYHRTAWQDFQDGNPSDVS
jgi:hypothetical protein